MAPADPVQTELVTVMIPAYNEEQFIGRCLDSVRQQDYRNLQIVVVDGCSTDGTEEQVRARMAEDDRIELVSNPRRIIPVALNLAAQAARGRWLVRVDAHSSVEATYVSQAVARLSEGRWGGVGGRKDGVGQTTAGRAIAAALGSRFGVGNSMYHHGTTAQEVDHIPFGSYPVALIRELGGWDEGLPANEDFEFDYRLRQAGHRLLLDPEITIKWHSRQSIPDLFRQYYRYGQGKVDVAWKHPESMSARHVLPPAFVAYVALAAAASLPRPRRLGIALAPYALALAAATVQTGRTLGTPAERALVAPAFLAMHIGWGAGFWRGVARTAPAQVRGRLGRRLGGTSPDGGSPQQ